MVAFSPQSSALAIDPAEQPALTREQIIARLLDLSPGLEGDRLARFEAPALQLYLDHMLAAREPRGRSAAWRRPGDTPGILKRDPRDD